ncbi:MAG: phosphoribosylanthranilate isomerase [Rhizomicrobium sp.]
MRTRIKICGMTRPADVQAAARLGVDAIGLVFHAHSARHLNLARAGELVRSVPAFVTVTGLFLDASRTEVQRTLDAVRLDLLQFHGEESPEFCRGFGRPYVKALAMGAAPDLADCARRYHDAAALLLDSHVPGQAGGTGTTFDWQHVPQGADLPLILAGGLNAANVAAAIRAVHPYAVDVSSGVESAPGIKDAVRMTEFVREVNRVTGV